LTDITKTWGENRILGRGGGRQSRLETAKNRKQKRSYTNFVISGARGSCAWQLFHAHGFASESYVCFSAIRTASLSTSPCILLEIAIYVYYTAFLYLDFSASICLNQKFLIIEAKFKCGKKSQIIRYCTCPKQHNMIIRLINSGPQGMQYQLA
jgi:hypothetical protein